MERETVEIKRDAYLQQLIANIFASERQMAYTDKTISNHIDYLADAFLISKAIRGTI